MNGQMLPLEELHIGPKQFSVLRKNEGLSFVRQCHADRQPLTQQSVTNIISANKYQNLPPAQRELFRHT